MLTKIFQIAIMAIFFAECGCAYELYVLHPQQLANQFQVSGGAQKGGIRASLGAFGFYDKHSVFRGRVHYPLRN